MDDRQTMERIAGGDEAALQALLRRFGPLIRYILRPILPDERDRVSASRTSPCGYGRTRRALTVGRAA